MTAAGQQHPNLPGDVSDLFRAALEAGLHEVHAGFADFDDDIPGPTGWMLHLFRYSVDNANTAAFRNAVGDGDLREFIQSGIRTVHAGPGVPTSSLSDRGEWLNTDAIEEWIRQQSPVDGRLTPDEVEVLGRDADMLVGAVNRGWSVSRRLRLEHAGPGTATAASFTFDAINNFYNTEGHPQHRSTGVPVSQHVAFVSETVSIDDAFWAAVGTVKTDTGEVRALIAAEAPWRVPVTARPDLDNIDD